MVDVCAIKTVKLIDKYIVTTAHLNSNIKFSDRFRIQTGITVVSNVSTRTMSSNERSRGAAAHATLSLLLNVTLPEGEC